MMLDQVFTQSSTLSSVTQPAVVVDNEQSASQLTTVVLFQDSSDTSSSSNTGLTTTIIINHSTQSTTMFDGVFGDSSAFISTTISTVIQTSVVDDTDEFISQISTPSSFLDYFSTNTTSDLPFTTTIKIQDYTASAMIFDDMSGESSTFSTVTQTSVVFDTEQSASQFTTAVLFQDSSDTSSSSNSPLTTPITIQESTSSTMMFDDMSGDSSTFSTVTQTSVFFDTEQPASQLTTAVLFQDTSGTSSNSNTRLTTTIIINDSTESTAMSDGVFGRSSTFLAYFTTVTTSGLLLASAVTNQDTTAGSVMPDQVFRQSSTLSSVAETALVVDTEQSTSHLTTAVLCQDGSDTSSSSNTGLTTTIIINDSTESTAMFDGVFGGSSRISTVTQTSVVDDTDEFISQISTASSFLDYFTTGTTSALILTTAITELAASQLTVLFQDGTDTSSSSNSPLTTAITIQESTSSTMMFDDMSGESTTFSAVTQTSVVFDTEQAASQRTVLFQDGTDTSSSLDTAVSTIVITEDSTESNVIVDTDDVVSSSPPLVTSTPIMEPRCHKLFFTIGPTSTPSHFVRMATLYIRISISNHTTKRSLPLIIYVSHCNFTTVDETTLKDSTTLHSSVSETSSSSKSPLTTAITIQEHTSSTMMFDDMSGESSTFATVTHTSVVLNTDKVISQVTTSFQDDSATSKSANPPLTTATINHESIATVDESFALSVTQTTSLTTRTIIQVSTLSTTTFGTNPEASTSALLTISTSTSIRVTTTTSTSTPVTTRASTSTRVTTTTAISELNVRQEGEMRILLGCIYVSSPVSMTLMMRGWC
ncbi:unnamed protein product [Didymodactylos carnosus]|uniref:Uncharacterized protein n=1 Tax=Didymodactylos carnosus TaxID=1234261 RepID=A0A814KVZ9_9BILA|nr:unnamed protein product [Didymodactylos carnosus]CAF3825602.1 unnamed protein product [Didymodactylos carnosus]